MVAKTPSDFGAALREAREKAGMWRSDLIAAIRKRGFEPPSKDAIRALEEGRAKYPHRSTLSKYASVFPSLRVFNVKQN